MKHINDFFNSPRRLWNAILWLFWIIVIVEVLL